MRIYFASVLDPRAKRVCSELGVRNYLLSFAAGKRAFEQSSDILQNSGCRVIVDSGAFSAWSKGKRIDLNRYADFAHALKERVKCDLIFVNLDVIPGRRGTRPTDYERDISAERSYRNWQYLHGQGIPTMNVFHQHERFYWLDEFKKHSDYIGISPANDLSVDERDHWLRQVFQCIGCSVKTHGFGVTAAPLLLHFPFFSVDSTTWMSGVKYGSYVSMNWKKLGIDQIAAHRFHENLDRVAKDVVMFSRSPAYKFHVGVSGFLQFERFLTDVWKEERGVLWDDPRFPELTPGSATLGKSGSAKFDGRQLTCKAVPQELIRSLNEISGAQLRVWLAHFMDSDDKGISNLSVGWLKRLTGLNYETIASARSWLSRNGWLVPQPESARHRGRFAPKMFQVALPLKPWASTSPSPEKVGTV